MAPSSRKRPRKDTAGDLEHQGRAPQSSPETVVGDIPPGKKARLLIDDSNSVTAPTPKESRILKLPVEILGEILILTGSSQHVLAVARTCKQFCYTLLDEGAQYIWRKARHGLLCSVMDFTLIHLPKPNTFFPPDPPKEFFSEAAYAAFLFDPGTCFNCGKKTPIPYASFALRIRICHRPSCARLPDDLEDPGGFELLVPTNEMNEIIARSGTNFQYWPTHYATFGRKTDIDEARNQFLSESSADQAKKLRSLRKRNGEWMKFCSALAKWKITFNEYYLAVKSCNARIAHMVASASGYDPDLLNCTVFASYCKQKTRFLEIVYLSDVDQMRDQIEVELLALDEKRQRCKIETSLMKNRADIVGLYNNLRSSGAYSYLPSLATFRQLPVIRLLEAGTYDGNSRTKIADTLRSGTLIRQRLDQDVERWVVTAKQDLAVVLGFPKNWKSPNKHNLHPVERGTAWFICKICGIDEANYKTGGCLDFAGACLHVCKDGKDNRHRKSKKATWDSEKFTADEKGSNAMKNFLTQLGLCEESVGLFPKYNGVAVLCTSCNPSMVLKSSDLIGHSHRHDNMEVSMISSDDTIQFLGGFRYSSGVVKHLLRQGGAAIQMEINEKNFGCRICLRKKQDDSGENPVLKPFESEDLSSLPVLNFCFSSEIPKEIPPLFNFNGMRSHLKAKHGIEHIRDEYFLCAKPIGDNKCDLPI